MKYIINFFAISLLILLAILGTLIPQRLEAINYINGFPKTWQLILWFGFDDMYRSSLFISILTLLSVSAIICVIIRYKSIYKKLFNKFDNISTKDILSFKASKEFTNSVNNDYFKRFTPFKLRDNTNVALRNYGKMSFIGGLIGLIFGVEMPISGKAGEKIPVPQIEVIRAAYKADKMSRKARLIRQFSPMNPELEKMRAEIEKLHELYNAGLMNPEFKVFFNKLWIDHYTDSKGEKAGIKSWNVEMKFIDVVSGSLFDEKKESQAVVAKVNEPVSYKDWNFYLANWNKNWNRLKLNIELISDLNESEKIKFGKVKFPLEKEVGFSEPFKITGYPYYLVITDFYPDFRTSNGVNFSASQELKNPAVKITAFDRFNQTIIGHTWAFADDKPVMTDVHKFNNNIPFKFIFKNADFDYECIMQMAYDPGTTFVWIGCFMLCFGMMLSFYISYREEWLILDKNGRVTNIALNSNRSENVLKKELEAFEERLTNRNEVNNE